MENEIANDKPSQEEPNQTSKLSLKTLEARIIELEGSAGIEKRVERLERVIAKIAHYSGQHKIMVDYGIEPWLPGKEDMNKFKE